MHLRIEGANLPLTEGSPQIVQKVEGLVSFFELPVWTQELQKARYLPEHIVIADPLSYCAGVVRANKAADELLERYSEKQNVYFYHAPIHNDTKVAEWQAKGAKIVDSLDKVPDYSVVLFSAHGISPEIWLQAKAKHLKGKDATCPLVDKTHREVKELRDAGFKVLLVGYKDHDEIVGTFGEAPENILVIDPHASQWQLENILVDLEDAKIALRNQTTLAVSDLLHLIEHVKKSRPDVNLAKKSDICYATENRQEAVIATIVVAGVRNIGVSAGASADPKRIVEFLAIMRGIGLKTSQIMKVTVAQEPQIFSPARDFDFSQS